MSYFLNPTIPSNYDDVWLIGFRVDPDREQPDFYTIFFNGDRDIPLNENGYIIFFNDLEILYKTIKKIIPEFYSELKETELFTIDVAEMLYLIQTKSIDEYSTIVNSLNIIIDILNCTTKFFPKDYKTKLLWCADYFTFSKNISDFFIKSKIDREEMVNIIQWSIGTIVSRSKFYTSNDFFTNYQK